MSDQIEQREVGQPFPFLWAHNDEPRHPRTPINFTSATGATRRSPSRLEAA
jgi:hypothetical protein